MKKIAKFLGLMLALSILLTILAFAAPPLYPTTQLTPVKPSMTFSDVKTGDWFYKNMDTLVRAGGVNGYEDGTFRPNAGLTLAEFIKTLVAIVYPGQTSYWADYQIGGKVRWYSEYIGAAVEAGLLIGVDYSYAALEAPVSRYVMAVVMVNASDIMGYPLSDDEDISYVIYDYNAIPGSYKPYVRKAYYAGLLTGKDTKGSFDGAAGLTRAEACTAIVRLFDDTQRAEFAYFFVDYGTYTLAVKTPLIWYDEVVNIDLEIAENGKNGYLFNFFCISAISEEYDGWLTSILFTTFTERIDKTESEFKYISNDLGMYTYYYDYNANSGVPSYNPNDTAVATLYKQLKSDVDKGLISIIVKYK